MLREQSAQARSVVRFRLPPGFKVAAAAAVLLSDRFPEFPVVGSDKTEPRQKQSCRYVERPLDHPLWNLWHEPQNKCNDTSEEKSEKQSPVATVVPQKGDNILVRLLLQEDTSPDTPEDPARDKRDDAEVDVDDAEVGFPVLLPVHVPESNAHQVAQRDSGNVVEPCDAEHSPRECHTGVFLIATPPATGRAPATTTCRLRRAKALQQWLFFVSTAVRVVFRCSSLDVAWRSVARLTAAIVVRPVAAVHLPQNEIYRVFVGELHGGVDEQQQRAESPEEIAHVFEALEQPVLHDEGEAKEPHTVPKEGQQEKTDQQPLISGAGDALGALRPESTRCLAHPLCERTGSGSRKFLFLLVRAVGAIGVAARAVSVVVGCVVFPLDQKPFLT